MGILRRLRDSAIILSFLMQFICSSAEYFTVVAPSQIRPSSNFTIGVSGHSKNPPPISVYLKCEPKIVSNQDQQIDIGTYRLKADESTTTTIFIPSFLVAEKFELCVLFTVDADTSEEYDQRPLRLMSSKEADPTSIFVQMDKPAYKPKEEIRIRIIILDKDNLPNPNALVNVTLHDAKEFLMNRWPTDKNIHKLKKDKNGLLTLRLQLAKELNFGTWKLTVTTKSSRLEKSFRVEKYILPKFYIKFNLSPLSYMTPTTDSLILEISAMYTYGKPVVGNVSLALYNTRQPNLRKTFRVTELTGAGAMYNLAAATDFVGGVTAGSEFILEANVTEVNTGRVQQGSRVIKVFATDPYKITWLNPQGVFKQGSPFKVQIAVSNFEDMPVTDKGKDVLKLTFTFSSGKSETLYSRIPESGLVTFLVPVPEPGVRYQSISLQYKSATKTLPIPRPFRTGDGSPGEYFSVKLSGRNVHFQRGDSMRVELRPQHILPGRINYVLWSGSEIIGFNSGTPDAFGRLEIILPTKTFYSELQLVVYFVESASGRVISASVTLPTSNFLKMSISKLNVNPADSIAIQFQTHPGSTIGLRGIDQSLVLLSRDPDSNDIDPRSIPFNPRHVRSRHMSDSGYTTSDYYSEFRNTGLEILTNGDIGETTSRLKKRDVDYDYEDDDNQRPPLIGSLEKFYDEPVRTRTEFPETWLWELIPAANTTTTLYSGGKAPKVPDTMTSWILTAFSINCKSGLAVTAAPKIVTVFRPFFITLNHPYSVVRGETFELQVIVHNYLGADKLAHITFYNEDMKFTFASTKEQLEENATKTVLVKDKEVNVVSFVIMPLEVGHLRLNLKAVTDVAGDAIRKTIVVDNPEVKKWTKAKPIIYYGKKNDSSHTFPVKVSNRRKRDASYKVSLSSDPIQTSHKLDEHGKVESLIALPTGCGEQNMMSFVPNIIALDYLQAIGKSDEGIQSRIASNIQVGYQKQMTYFNPTQGYFSYHPGQSVRSTWLTAFILRCFTSASKYITIDHSVITKGLKYLLSQQNSMTGEFMDADNGLYHKFYSERLQGGLAKQGSKYGITAYVTLALIEISSALQQELKREDLILLDNAKLKGLKFISSESSLVDSDPHSLVIVTCTLHAANHVSRDAFFNKMEKSAMTSNNGEYKFWQYNSKAIETPVTAQTVEMTGYALMTMVWRSQTALAASLPIVKWLLKERTVNGGFKSTQDTVIGLTALAKYANRTRYSDGEQSDVGIVVKTNTNEIFEFSFHKGNLNEVHDLFLPEDTESFSVTSSGKGRVFIDYSEGTYDDMPDSGGSKFVISGVLKADPKRDKISKLTACVSYNSSTGLSAEALATVTLPSAYTFEKQEVARLAKKVQKGPLFNVNKIQTRQGAKMVDIYYNSLSNKPTCLDLEVYKAYEVVQRTNGTISVTDYYNPTIHGKAPIVVDKKTTICDLCLNTGECDIVSGCTD